MKDEKIRTAWSVIIDHEIIPKIKFLAGKKKISIGEYLEHLIEKEFSEAKNE